MENRGHHDLINVDYYINISANSNTLKSVLILEEDYQVDFNHQNSIVKVPPAGRGVEFAGCRPAEW